MRLAAPFFDKAAGDLLYGTRRYWSVGDELGVQWNVSRHCPPARKVPQGVGSAQGVRSAGTGVWSMVAVVHGMESTKRPQHAPSLTRNRNEPRLSEHIIVCSPSAGGPQGVVSGSLQAAPVLVSQRLHP